jgi:hypothetical protein
MQLLFHRDFMEYHSDRFQDYSLCGFEEDKLCGITQTELRTVYSHQGLTYGGLVYSSKINGEIVADIIESLLFFVGNGDEVL